MNSGEPSAQTPVWQVLLIGGSSGTGKSILARALSHRLGIPALELDDFRLVIERVVQQAQTRVSTPDLWVELGVQAIREVGQRFVDTDATPESMCQGLIATANVMSNAIEIVIAHHIATRKPVIIEGDGIQPSLVMRRPVANLDPAPGQLQSIILVEDDENELLHAFQERDPEFAGAPVAEQRRIVRAHWLYGQWLKTESHRLALPVAVPRPYQTLIERVLSIFRSSEG